MHCSIPEIASKDLSKIFTTDLQVQKSVAVGPDERLYYCNDNYLVWVRDYMPEDCQISEPRELKAMLGLDVAVKDLQDYQENRYMLCKNLTR